MSWLFCAMMQNVNKAKKTQHKTLPLLTKEFCFQFYCSSLINILHFFFMLLYWPS